jgi:hypothetical protein
MAGIEGVAYRTGFVKWLGEAARLPAITIEGPTYPRTCSRSSITTSSTLAAPTATPRATRFSTTRYASSEGDVEIVVYNRAIPLFRSDSEAVRRILEGCCR